MDARVKPAHDEGRNVVRKSEIRCRRSDVADQRPTSDLRSPASDIRSPNLPELTVSELAFALKRTIEDAYGCVRVRGELGKVNYHSSGHVYVDLKDDRACLAGVIWRS